MTAKPNIVEVASLIGEPSRGAMLMSLLGGRALPASELARVARVTPQTASSHLAKMVEGGLLVHESYGRHKYYRLASAEVAQALEVLNAIAPLKPIRSLRESNQLRALHFARMCYDHVAGEVGVSLTDKMLDLGLIRTEERDFIVTVDGDRWFRDFGIDLSIIRHQRRHFARQCLDWSERRNHLAGALGAALTSRLYELEWLEQVPGARTVRVTREGFTRLERDLGVTFEERRGSVENFPCSFGY